MLVLVLLDVLVLVEVELDFDVLVDLLARADPDTATACHPARTINQRWDVHGLPSPCRRSRYQAVPPPVRVLGVPQAHRQVPSLPRTVRDLHGLRHRGHFRSVGTEYLVRTT